MRTHQKTGSRFIPELEATRGIAALLVAGYHAAGIPITVNGIQTSLIEAASRSENLLEHATSIVFATVLNGDSAVLYFFVLSGFVLAASLEREGSPTWATALRFGLRRIFRIYPAVIFTVLALAALYHATGLALHPEAFGLTSILRNAALLDVTINGVMWTMQTELLATPVIFLCVLLAARGWASAAIGLAAVLAALSFAPDWTHLFIGRGISRTLPLYAFAFGVLAYLNGRWIAGRIGGHRNGVTLAAVFAFFVASLLFGFGSEVTALIQVTASALVIALLAFGRGDAPSGVLTSAPARLIGRISYSFYLLHPLALAIAWPMVSTWTALADAGIPASILLVGLWAATSAAIIPIAMFSHRYVELPAIALGRRIGQLRFHRDVPAAG